MKKDTQNKNTTTGKKGLNVPLESSLGWLAVGDIAFEAWRETKKQHNKDTTKK